MTAVTEAYLQFLEYVLPLFNKLNALFQSKKNLIGILQEESQRLLRCLRQNFIKPEALQNLASIKPMDPRILLPLEEVYLGEKCKKVLNGFQATEPSEAHNLRLRCLSFYQTAVVEVQKRLPIFAPFFTDVAFVRPATALSYEARRKLPALLLLQERYKHLLPCPEAVQQEWRMLPAHFPEDKKKELVTKTSAAFWCDISKLQTFDGKQEFADISTLAKLILSLPHSNADTERIFFMMSDVKTKRNKLGPSSINAVLIVKSAMASKGTACKDMKV
ncbi:uncharacterized protein LOC115314038 [Ixodes scapularis]|uniref:uncharacterized protein LOC115314038 n=1 Tax=Ixodes scapularis TaxID=6945 RepID=UPI001A9D689A|nr:uncharacterized protein LOC115314038 [Ixodes scapularis]